MTRPFSDAAARYSAACWAAGAFSTMFRMSPQTATSRLTLFPPGVGRQAEFDAYLRILVEDREQGSRIGGQSRELQVGSVGEAVAVEAGRD